MAKVMISIPDDLLARLDAEAKRRGLTRSGFLRDLADRELTMEAEARRKEILTILARVRGHYGGDSTAFIREMRNSR